jgi:hypothetical protein
MIIHHNVYRNLKLVEHVDGRPPRLFKKEKKKRVASLALSLAGFE